MGRKKKAEEKKTVIHIGSKARQAIREMMPQVVAFNQYVRGIRDSLNVPETWMPSPDWSGFVAPKGDKDGGK